MSVEKKENEYGRFLNKPFLDTPKDRIIVYLHDHLDNPDIFDDFAEPLNLFHYYSLALPGDEMFETEEIYKNSYNYTCHYVRDLILSFNAKQVFIIASGSAAPIAVFLGNLIPKKIKKICLINPFTSKSSIETIQWMSTLPRCVEDTFVIAKKMYYPDDMKIFNQGENSKRVVSMMKNVYHHWADIANYVEDITSIKIMEQIRLYEENVVCPVQLILGEDDEWIPPHEALLAFNKTRNLSVVQIPKSKHYPLHDNKQTLIDSIMKFFIKDLGLNSDNRLPNKYLYKYLDDSWKQYYRGAFAEKLSARDLEEYEKKIKEYEKEEASIKFVNEEYKDYIKEHVNYATRSLDDVYNQVDSIYKQNEAYKKQYKDYMKAMVEIDWNAPPNIISVNYQGYEVYHDGKGKGFYRYPGTKEWKKIEKD